MKNMTSAPKRDKRVRYHHRSCPSAVRYAPKNTTPRLSREGISDGPLASVEFGCMKTLTEITDLEMFPSLCSATLRGAHEENASSETQLTGCEVFLFFIQGTETQLN